MIQRYFIVLLCLISTLSWGQNLNIKGTVTDNNGELVGATVVVKGTTIGSVTDISGSFSVNAKATDVLVFSFIGYTSQDVPVNGQTVINVELSADIAELDQVVIVGYGTQKKASVVAAITQASGDDILKTGSNNNISQAIQGLMPGVVSISGTGKPGAEDATIQIRGVGTWDDASPLILVDGIERSMNNVDPNEIESISVLKDASATAVFGVKGGNGVILITTKRGTVGKPEISFSSEFGVKQPTSKPEFSDYVTAMEMWNEALVNDFQWDRLIPESTIEAWRQNWDKAGPYNDYFPNIDWWDEMIKPYGYQHKHNVNVRGGSEYMRYFASLGYLWDDDIFKSQENDLFDPTYYYKRYNWRVNFDFDITKTTVLTVNLAGNQGIRNQNGYRFGDDKIDDDSKDNFFGGLYTAPSNHFPIKWSDGEWGTGINGQGNIKAGFDLGSRTFKTFEGFLDLKLKQDLDFITKGLRLNGSFSYTTLSGFQTSIQRYEGDRFGDVWQIQYYRQFDYANPNPDGTYNYLVNDRWPADEDLTTARVSLATNQDLIKGRYKKNMYYDLALNYARTFGLHDVTGLFLFSRREDQFLNSESNENFAIKMRQEDWVGRFTYAYAGKYLSEVNFAYNGTENFAPGNRFGFFPSASLGWVVSEESFIKENVSHVVDLLKLRYSYGQSGNDKIKGNRFAYQQEYTVGGNIHLGYDNRVNWGPLYDEGKAANPNVQWEVATKHNLGFEFGLFSKVIGNVDVYAESRDRILMDSWTPIWVVQKDATANLGKTKNHGIELELGWRDRVSKDFRYTVKGYVALNENRIVERGDGYSTPDHLKQAGKPVKWESMFIDNGYYSSLDDIYINAIPGDVATQSKLVPGDLMFVDFNADGVIDQNDQVVHRNVKYPLSTYGLTLDANYKGWSVNVRFYGVSNMNKHIIDAILWDNWNGTQGIYKAGPEVLGRWTPENAENAIKPVLHSNFGSYSKSNSTYTYRPSAYFRLKNVELAYNFQAKSLQILGLSSLQVYANANNLFTWTKLDKRLDPEVTKQGVFPLTKRTNIGLRVSF